MSSIQLGKHTIEVSVSAGIRMVKQSDTKDLLGLKESEVSSYFIDSEFVTDTLFDKIYKDKKSIKEQEIIFRGLCKVGIHSLIDEACKIDLRGVSYIEEFAEFIRFTKNDKL